MLKWRNEGETVSFFRRSSKSTRGVGEDRPTVGSSRLDHSCSDDPQPETHPCLRDHSLDPRYWPTSLCDLCASLFFAARTSGQPGTSDRPTPPGGQHSGIPAGRNDSRASL